MQNRWCGSNIRKFHHRSGNFRSCLEAARYRTSWAARCEFFNDLKSTINLRLVSFQNVAPHSLGCREQKLVHMDMPNVSIFFCFPGVRSVLAGHGFQWAAHGNWWRRSLLLRWRRLFFPSLIIFFQQCSVDKNVPRLRIGSFWSGLRPRTPSNSSWRLQELLEKSRCLVTTDTGIERIYH